MLGVEEYDEAVRQAIILPEEAGVTRISHRAAVCIMKDRFSSVPYWLCFEGLRLQTVLGAPPR